MSILDTTPDFDIMRSAWERPIHTGILGSREVRNICEILNPMDMYIPDGVRLIESDSFPQTIAGSLGTVSIPAYCTVSPYAFNNAWVKRIICRGPISVDPEDSFLAFIPSLEEATIRVSNWPIKDSPRNRLQLPLIEECNSLRILRLGGMPRFPDSIIRGCMRLEVLFTDADVEEVHLGVFHDCTNVKEIIPDNPKTIIPWWYTTTQYKFGTEI